MKESNTNKVLTYPSKILHPSNKENGLVSPKTNSISLHQESICFNYTPHILKSDLQSPIESTVTKFHERMHSDLTELTANKFDLSALCLNISSYVYIIGGFAENHHMNVERLDLQKGQWEVMSSLPCSLSKFATVILPGSGNILLLGGKDVSIFTTHPINCLGRSTYSQMS